MRCKAATAPVASAEFTMKVYKWESISSIYLTVQSEAEQHEEEEHSPELRHWHVGKGLWVNNKNQSRT